MDSFQLNKIAGAILSALLVIVGSNMLIEVLFDSHAPEKPGYIVETTPKEKSGEATAAKQEASAETIDLAAADPTKGQKILKKCTACHSFDAGGPNKTGPNLHGIFGRPLASVDGFQYSQALKAKGGDWTLEMLDCFLKKPSKCVKGTTMGFVGLKKPNDRANLIAYLKNLGG